jgi:hypothetical protein
MKGQSAITHSKLDPPSSGAGTAAGGPAAAAAAAAAAGGGEDDDDIFGEAGTDYVPEIPKKKVTENGQAK